MSLFSQNDWAMWPFNSNPDLFTNSAYSQISNPNYSSYLTEPMDYQSQQHRLLNQPMSRSTESKPRLSKEEVEILEAEFQKNHKPNTTIKKALAESMRVDNARINNWFQNRRAREKKEKNIRDYEAKQRQEKEKAVADGVIAGPDRRQDLVASSAPFPGSKSSFHAVSTTESPKSCVDDAAFDLVKVDDAAPSSETTPDLVSETAAAFSNKTGQESSVDEPAQDISPLDTQGYLQIGDASADGMVLNETDSFMPMANSSPAQLLDSDLHTSANQFFSSPMFLEAFSTNQPSFDMIDRDISISPTSQLPRDMSLKSPPCIGIATRRNRRPTPLALATRSAVSGSGIPKTAKDFALGTESAKFMRRTSSSSSSSGRITKPTTTPRKMITVRHSSSSIGAAGLIAPQTPGTPIIFSAQNLLDSSLSGAFTLDTKIPGLTSHDTTYSTPPTTPGVMDGVLGMNSAYSMGLADEYIINTGLAGMPPFFDMSTMSAPGSVNSNIPLGAQQQAYIFQQQSTDQLGFDGSTGWSST